MKSPRCCHIYILYWKWYLLHWITTYTSKPNKQTQTGSHGVQTIATVSSGGNCLALETEEFGPSLTAESKAKYISAENNNTQHCSKKLLYKSQNKFAYSTSYIMWLLVVGKCTDIYLMQYKWVSFLNWDSSFLSWCTMPLSNSSVAHQNEDQEDDEDHNDYSTADSYSHSNDKTSGNWPRRLT